MTELFYSLLTNFPFPTVTVIVGIAAYVVFPILIRCVFHYSVPTDYLVLDSDDLELPDEVERIVSQQTPVLNRLGFRTVATFALPKLVNNAASISMMMVNERAGDSMMISVVWSQSTDVVIKVKYTEFVRRFANGGCLQTSNAPRIGSFRAPPNDHTLHLWHIQNVAELYRVHVMAAKSLAYGRAHLSVIEDFQGDVEAFVQRKVVAEPAEYQETIGIFRKTQGGYGLTWVGAYLLCWKELFPVKQCIRWQCRRKSLQWLSRIERTA